MSNITTRRLEREVEELRKIEAFKVDLVNDSLYQMKAVITGPPDTPYVGGVFRLKIEIPEKYPFTPPEVKFETKIWHPNIDSQTGVNCSHNVWKPVNTIHSILYALEVLLQYPVARDPLDVVVAHQYLTDLKGFKRTAAYWTAVFAMSNSATERQKFTEYEAKLAELKGFKLKNSKGQDFSEHDLISALSGNGWNIEKAKHALL